MHRLPRSCSCLLRFLSGSMPTNQKCDLPCVHSHFLRTKKGTHERWLSYVCTVFCLLRSREHSQRIETRRTYSAGRHSLESVYPTLFGAQIYSHMYRNRVSKWLLVGLTLSVNRPDWLCLHNSLWDCAHCEGIWADFSHSIYLAGSGKMIYVCFQAAAVSMCKRDGWRVGCFKNSYQNRCGKTRCCWRNEGRDMAMHYILDQANRCLVPIGINTTGLGT